LLALRLVQKDKGAEFVSAIASGSHPMAPTFDLPGLDSSERVSLTSLRGKVVVVNFWASWCAPCRAESPNLVKVATETAPLGVAFLGVNFKDDRDAARRFTDVQGVPYPSLFDQPGVILTRLRKLVPPQPPSTMLIDKTGRIAALFVGGVTETELSGPVQALAGETSAVPSDG
jgi:thiol-disulfide isomerase/thioredoxin